MFLNAEKLLLLITRKEEITEYGEVSKWNRARPHPVDDEGSAQGLCSNTVKTSILYVCEV